jgi:hypothetical protein
MMKIIFSFECVWTQPSPGYSSENETCYIKYEFEFEFEFWCLTPLSAIFQLYRFAAASDKVYQLLAQGRWFSPGTPASSTTKTGRHDIAEILLKVVL